MPRYNPRTAARSKIKFPPNPTSQEEEGGGVREGEQEQAHAEGEGEGEGEGAAENEQEDEQKEDDRSATIVEIDFLSLCFSQPGEKQEVLEDNEDNFRAQLGAIGLRIVDIKGDGNCMFRALAEQLDGDQELHEAYRHMVVDYMIKHPQDFKNFFAEEGAVSFEKYCEEMLQDGRWGGNLELQAASMLFRTNIRIHQFIEGLLNFSDITNFSSAETLLLSYHNGNHYNGLRLIRFPPNPTSQEEQGEGVREEEQEQAQAQAEGAAENEQEDEQKENDRSATIVEVDFLSLCFSQPGEKQEMLEDNEDKFRAQLGAIGLRIVDIKGDGNCMFRALAEQLDGDQELHEAYRHMVVDYMIKHPQDFKNFLAEEGAVSFEKYCEELLQDGSWGGNLELQAASMLFRTNIRIHQFIEGLLNFSDITNFSGAETLLLSYHNGNHYNSLRLQSDDAGAVKITEHKGKEKMADSEAPSAAASEVKKYDEDLVNFIAGATGFTNVAGIHDLLVLVNGDPSAVIDLILNELSRNQETSEREIVERSPSTEKINQVYSRKRQRNT